MTAPAPPWARSAAALLGAAWLLAASSPALAADRVLDFHGGAMAADLACPEPPAARYPPPETADTAQMPSDEELGPLARPVVRAQPRIDPGVSSGFALAGASATRPRRIAVWGDSHVAAGPLMGTLMERLESRGYAVAPRFLPPTMGRANVRLRALHAYCIGPAWSTELAYASIERRLVGPALMNRVAEAGAASYLWLDLRDRGQRSIVRQVEVVYRAPEGAALEVSVNDGPAQRAVLNPSGLSQSLVIRNVDGIATLRLRVSGGRLVLHGFALDYLEPPAVTFDVFGLPSATAQGWASLDPHYLAQSLQGEGYDAVVLEYGTNEGADPHFDEERYVAALTAALANLREVFPHASCLLIGPPDRGVLRRRAGDRLDILGYSRTVERIEAVQSEVGPRFGCAHWDWQALMGGPGGSYGWARNTPPLMGPDLTHLTASGYRLSADALASSLGF